MWDDEHNTYFSKYKTDWKLISQKKGDLDQKKCLLHKKNLEATNLYKN